VKVGLNDPLKDELNSILKQMIPETDEHKKWIGFEDSYEKSMY
jgi:hypothetical protein